MPAEVEFENPFSARVGGSAASNLAATWLPRRSLIDGISGDAPEVDAIISACVGRVRVPPLARRASRLDASHLGPLRAIDEKAAQCAVGMSIATVYQMISMSLQTAIR